MVRKEKRKETRVPSQDEKRKDRRTKRKYHFRESSPSEISSGNRGQSRSKLNCRCHLEEDANSKDLEIQSHHALTRERKLRSRLKRHKRRERSQQAQKQTEDSERSEFKRHMKKAQEIASKCNVDYPKGHSDPMPASVITENRLTRKLGIYNQGKKSNKIFRDSIIVPKAVQVRTEEGLKRILDIRSSEKAQSSSSSWSCNIDEKDKSPVSSCYDKPADVHTTVGDWRLHKTPPQSSKIIQTDNAISDTSCDQSSPSSKPSEEKTFSKSPLRKEFGVEFTASLDLDKWFPDHEDYVTKIYKELRKLIPMTSPSDLSDEDFVTPSKADNVSSTNTKPSVRRRLDDELIIAGQDRLSFLKSCMKNNKSLFHITAHLRKQRKEKTDRPDRHPVGNQQLKHGNTPTSVSVQNPTNLGSESSNEDLSGLSSLGKFKKACGISYHRMKVTHLDLGRSTRKQGGKKDPFSSHPENQPIGDKQHVNENVTCHHGKSTCCTENVTHHHGDSRCKKGMTCHHGGDVSSDGRNNHGTSHTQCCHEPNDISTGGQKNHGTSHTQCCHEPNDISTGGRNSQGISHTQCSHEPNDISTGGQNNHGTTQTQCCHEQSDSRHCRFGNSRGGTRPLCDPSNNSNCYNETKMQPNCDICLNNKKHQGRDSSNCHINVNQCCLRHNTDEAHARRDNVVESSHTVHQPDPVVESSHAVHQSDPSCSYINSDQSHSKHNQPDPSNLQNNFNKLDLKGKDAIVSHHRDHPLQQHDPSCTPINLDQTHDRDNNAISSSHRDHGPDPTNRHSIADESRVIHKDTAVSSDREHQPDPPRSFFNFVETHDRDNNVIASSHRSHGPDQSRVIHKDTAVSSHRDNQPDSSHSHIHSDQSNARHQNVIVYNSREYRSDPADRQIDYNQSDSRSTNMRNFDKAKYPINSSNNRSIHHKKEVRFEQAGVSRDTQLQAYPNTRSNNSHNNLKYQNSRASESSRRPESRRNYDDRSNSRYDAVNASGDARRQRGLSYTSSAEDCKLRYDGVKLLINTRTQHQPLILYKYPKRHNTQLEKINNLRLQDNRDRRLKGGQVASDHDRNAQHHRQDHRMEYDSRDPPGTHGGRLHNACSESKPRHNDREENRSGKANTAGMKTDENNRQADQKELSTEMTKDQLMDAMMDGIQFIRRAEEMEQMWAQCEEKEKSKSKMTDPANSHTKQDQNGGKRSAGHENEEDTDGRREAVRDQERNPNGRDQEMRDQSGRDQPRDEAIWDQEKSKGVGDQERNQNRRDQERRAQYERDPARDDAIWDQERSQVMRDQEKNKNGRDQERRNQNGRDQVRDEAICDQERSQVMRDQERNPNGRDQERRDQKGRDQVMDQAIWDQERSKDVGDQERNQNRRDQERRDQYERDRARDDAIWDQERSQAMRDQERNQNGRDQERRDQNGRDQARDDNGRVQEKDDTIWDHDRRGQVMIDQGRNNNVRDQERHDSNEKVQERDEAISDHDRTGEDRRDQYRRDQNESLHNRKNQEENESMRGPERREQATMDHRSYEERRDQNDRVEDRRHHNGRVEDWRDQNGRVEDRRDQDIWDQGRRGQTMTNQERRDQAKRDQDRKEYRQSQNASVTENQIRRQSRSQRQLELGVYDERHTLHHHRQHPDKLGHEEHTRGRRENQEERRDYSRQNEPRSQTKRGRHEVTYPRTLTSKRGQSQSSPGVQFPYPKIFQRKGRYSRWRRQTQTDSSESDEEDIIPSWYMDLALLPPIPSYVKTPKLYPQKMF